MGRISQGRQRVKSKSTNSDELLGRMRKQYPNLVELFGGDKDQKGAWVTEPGKITVWIEEGRIKFCLKPGNSSEIAFGSCLPSETTLDALEAAIERDDCEWRTAKPGFRS